MHFSDYKSGFEIRTTRLCKRVLLFHHFLEYDGLVKSLDFHYDFETQKDFTFIESITSYGYIKNPNGSYSQKNLPPTTFTYQKHTWNKDLKTISKENLVHVPAGIYDRMYQFTDLFNEGVSGILSEQANGWYYKQNLGNGEFSSAKCVSPKPSFAGLGSQLQLADLDANGGKQLVNYSEEPRGFFELTDEEEWLPFKNFQTLPNINFNDSNTRMLDLNGDGKAEILISEDNVFSWYESEGKDGFRKFHRTEKPLDEEAGPAIVFADSTQSIFLADMSGDGLTDIVRIRNGEVCYWPNLGYGKFGTKVLMDNAPLFDSNDAFNPAYIRLADIDGSGTTDIIYLGKNKFTCWNNLSGNSFNSSPFEIDGFLTFIITLQSQLQICLAMV
ncbi:MAG: VCBS repeat-containing protein [Flavobacteriales bacterium]|nr:VCBS repeat-containing protein [Flavobacteriales bacterium]